MKGRDYTVEVISDESRPAQPKVSIIIPVLNHVQMTSECVDSIERHTRSVEYELIIVNNGSTDGTREYLDSKDGVVALHCSRNIGVAPAWNLGIEHSSGEYLCIVNNDIVFTPGWLENLLWPFGADKRVWCTGPVFTSGPLPERFDQLAELVSESEPKLVLGGMVGFCFVLARQAIDQVGLFDEQYETAWYEDTDYYCRLLAAGHPPALATHSLIHHYETRTASAELPEGGLRILKKNQVRFKRKWKRLVDPGEDVLYVLPFGSLTVRQPAPQVLSDGQYS